MRKLMACVVALVATAAANAAVIDFNGLVGTGLVDRGFTYTEDGYTLTNLSTPFPFTSIHSGDSRYTGTPSFFNNTVNGLTRLTASDNSAFDLQSIALDSLNGGYNQTVTFTGFFAGGGTIVQAFMTDASFPGLQTFNFTGFTNLSRVEWTQTPNFHSFDNITVQASDVPEPVSLLVFGGLVAGGGWLARRRMKAAVA